jgi:hypothetical protein
MGDEDGETTSVAADRAGRARAVGRWWSRSKWGTPLALITAGSSVERHAAPNQTRGLRPLSSRLC